MRQRDLNRAVAQATGESVATIQRLGFLLAEPEQHDASQAEDKPNVIDWDELEQRQWYGQFHQDEGELFDASFADEPLADKEPLFAGVCDAPIPV